MPLQIVRNDITKMKVDAIVNAESVRECKSKAEMQEWLTAQKIVQTVLGEEEKERQQHEKKVHQEENR